MVYGKCTTESYIWYYDIYYIYACITEFQQCASGKVYLYLKYQLPSGYAPYSLNQINGNLKMILSGTKLLLQNDIHIKKRMILQII